MENIDDELDKMMNSFRLDIDDHIEKNHDPRSKHVGDIILIWDTSRLTEVDNVQVNTDPLDHQLLTTHPSIVVEEGCVFAQDLLFDDREYRCNLDLVVWNKTLNKKYRTNSSFVKLTTKKP